MMHRYIALIKVFYSSNRVFHKRYYKIIISALGSIFFCFILLDNFSALLYSTIHQDNQPSSVYLSSDPHLYFENTLLSHPDIYHQYTNHGYDFKVMIFDYTIQLSFDQFFNYNQQYITTLFDHEIILVGNYDLYYALCGLVEKSFLHYTDLNDYLSTLPLPVHLTINQQTVSFLLRGFTLDENTTIAILKNGWQWSERILKKAQCFLTTDIRMVRGKAIEYRSFIKKSNVDESKWDSTNFFICQEEVCMVQKASSPLFNASTLTGLEDPYIYLPLNPNLGGVYLEEGQFYLRNIQLQGIDFHLQFQLLESSIENSEIALSSALANYLGLQLKEGVTLSCRDNKRQYRIAKIIPSDQYIVYQNADWTYEECRLLNKASVNEFLTNQIALITPKNYQQLQEQYPLYTIIDEQEEWKKSSNFFTMYLKSGLQWIVTLVLVLSGIALFYSGLSDYRQQKKKYNLLRGYGYYDYEIILVVSMNQLFLGVISMLFSILFAVLFQSGLQILIQQWVSPSFMLIPLSGRLFTWCGGVVVLFSVASSLFPFVSLKDSQSDFTP